MKTLTQIGAELRGMVSADYDQIHALADAIDAHLAKAAQGEAVAWQYRRDGVEWHPLKEEFIEKAIRDGVEVRALYAASEQPVGAVGEDSREFVLRAMAMNYSDRHAWDHLDADACRRGADEIKALRGALEAIAERHGDKSVDGQIARAALAHPRPAGDAHPDDLAVDAFASAMKEKLAAARTKGRGGWNTDDASNLGLSIALRNHVEKGDPRDVANFAMFLYQRGESILPATTGEQAGEVAWTKKAAEFIEKKAQSYADEFGRDDMGSISFGAGRGADKMEEYWMSLIDLAEDFRKLGGKCQVPPDGWECSRAVGHDGPCAASPTASEDLPHGTKLYAQPRLTVPEGYRLVPVEPTEAMLVSGRNENLCCADDADRIYAAMIAAAPDGEVG